MTNELTRGILQEIDTLLRNGVLPVRLDHLKHLAHGEDVLGYLIAMKAEGLISGDLITIGVDETPHRMTNIRLTYVGIRALTQMLAEKAAESH